jgi:hypothetical protein
MNGLKNVVYVYAMETYSAISKNRTMGFEGKWMELEDTMLSEISQVQKDKYHIFSLICGR